MSTVISDQLCQEQFELAAQLANRYVHAHDADDYYFGSISGVSTLGMISQAVEQPTVLDIGAGSGLFLREALRYSAGQIRAVGLIAVDKRRTPEERIEWVFGDFQRPATWHPSDILEQGTVDLAVASLTFQHFADPLRALQNAINLLRPNGHLFVDKVNLPLEPGTATEALDIIDADLRENAGDYGFRSSYDEEKSLLVIRSLHLQRKTETDFSKLQISGATNSKVAYTVA